MKGTLKKKPNKNAVEFFSLNFILCKECLRLCHMIHSRQFNYFMLFFFSALTDESGHISFHEKEAKYTKTKKKKRKKGKLL